MDMGLCRILQRRGDPDLVYNSSINPDLMQVYSNMKEGNFEFVPGNRKAVDKKITWYNHVLSHGEMYATVNVQHHVNDQKLDSSDERNRLIGRYNIYVNTRCELDEKEIKDEFDMLWRETFGR